jgi:hypothetical protein
MVVGSNLLIALSAHSEVGADSTEPASFRPRQYRKYRAELRGFKNRD